MKSQLLELLKEKIELVEKTQKQMQPDVEANILAPGTVELTNMAHLNFRTAIEKLEMNTEKADGEALYFFGRGNWNMGEFHAHVKHDKEN